MAWLGMKKQSKDSKKNWLNDQCRNRIHFGSGKLQFTLHPEYSKTAIVPRRIWKVYWSKSRNRVQVPVHLPEMMKPKPLSHFRHFGKELTTRMELKIKTAYGKTAEEQVRWRSTNMNLSSSSSFSSKIVLKGSNNCQPLNHSLSVSAESRNPGTTLIKRSSRPNFLPTTSSTKNTDYVTETDFNSTTTTSTTIINESGEKVADLYNDSNDTVMGVDTAATRGGTLSQPCLPISSTIGATQIFPHLFLGSQKDVTDEEMMRFHGITYVLNVSKTCKKPEFIDDNHFHRISVRDSHQEKIIPFMNEAIDFIEKVRSTNDRVLVHCLAGVSRSATVAIAYVLQYFRINFEDAYRFVKEKRPSISPNFNFLGQLMEFEKSLKLSGHMDTKRTGSVSGVSDEERSIKFHCNGENDCKSTPTKAIITTSNSLFHKKKSLLCSAPKLVMPVTCSFQSSPLSSSAHHSTVDSGLEMTKTPASSFCRRRNAPILSKNVFGSSPMKKAAAGCQTPFSGKHHKELRFDGSQVLVDVLVTVPNSPRVVCDASRRLGSDGNEIDESAPSDSSSLTKDDIGTASTASTVFEVQEFMDFSDSTTSDCPTLSNEMEKRCDFLVPDFEDFRSKTAPTTPIIGDQRFKITSKASNPFAPSNKPHHLRHRRSISGGGLTEISPFNARRRFEACTKRSLSNNGVGSSERMDMECMETHSEPEIRRVSSFSETGSYYDLSEPSTRSPHKFVSLHSRSPKVLRKSLNLNLRPVYPYTASRQSNKAEVSSAPCVMQLDTRVPIFDCSHSMPTSTNSQTVSDSTSTLTTSNSNSNVDKSVDTLVINSMGPLTISSPSVENDKLFPDSPTSPATCPVLGKSSTLNRDPFSNYTELDHHQTSKLTYRASFTCSAPIRQNINEVDSSTRPFVLSASRDLKLPWRANKCRRRQSVDSGYLSSQTSSQSSSSFTSPTSQPTIFGSCTSNAENAADGIQPPRPRSSNSSCHAEGAFVNRSDDVPNKTNDVTNSTTVSHRNGVEIMSCS